RGAGLSLRLPLGEALSVEGNRPRTTGASPKGRPRESPPPAALLHPLRLAFLSGDRSRSRDRVPRPGWLGRDGRLSGTAWRLACCLDAAERGRRLRSRWLPWA